MAVSESKKTYMSRYNGLPSVKNKKAEYMRIRRAEKDSVAIRDLINFLLEMGYEDMAYDYAMERAPEMLISIKNRPQLGKV